MTLFHALLDWSEKSPALPAQRYKHAGKWKSITTQEMIDRVFHAALFLESKGFKKGDVSTIFSYNCPEWVHLDMAPSLLGGLSAGIYPNSNHKDIRYVLEFTQAKVICVQNKEYYQKLMGESSEFILPSSIEWVIVFEGDADFSPKAISYEAMIAEGRRLARNRSIQEFLKNVEPDAPAFMIFTSGTTGLPKGAMISHRNLASSAEIIMGSWHFNKGEHELFSFLPLSHIAEKVHNLAVGICWNFPVSFCTKFDNVGVEIVEVEPTLVLAVPRLWEKMKEGVERKLSTAPKVRQKLAAWAFACGEKMARSRYGFGTVGLTDVLEYKVADKLVLSKVRKALGFDRLKIGATGAAPISANVVWFFRKLGIELVELYGMTETTAVITATYPGVDGAGTVGTPFPGTEFKLGPDAEILTRGPCVFKGYYKNPEATRETIDSEGWFHTGDLGDLNEKGQLVIRGRKRDILKSSGGKMIAPSPIEERLKICNLIGQVCIVGDNKKYFVALVTLSEVAQGRGGINGVGVQEEIQAQFDLVNQSLASYEQVKRFRILDREFSIEKGELTPTLKMKRPQIEKSFADLIERMYQD